MLPSPARSARMAADGPGSVAAAKEALDCACPTCVHVLGPCWQCRSCWRSCCCSLCVSLKLLDAARRLALPYAVAHEISRLLDTGLDKETLSILIALVETGVNPEALAHVVKELRRESAELKAALAAVAAQPPLLATQASEGEPSEAQL